MNIVLILLPISAFVAGIFLIMFINAVRGGQFEDLDDAPWRILDDD